MDRILNDSREEALQHFPSAKKGTKLDDSLSIGDDQALS